MPALVMHDVDSQVIKGLGDREGGSCLYVDSWSVHGRHGHCRASQDRSGYAERYDSGNNENSPNTHDSSMAIPEVSGLSHDLGWPARRMCRSMDLFPLFRLSYALWIVISE
jgi:hypothetical protein